MGIPTPHSGLRASIKRWEGGWQAFPNDKGNWIICQGERRLIGTMRGVTPYAYARYCGVDPCSLTAEQMQAEITLDVAADIGLRDYFNLPRFNRLTYNPLVEIAADIGWGSGPAVGVRMLQRVVGRSVGGGIAVDGIIGPITMEAHERFIETEDIEDAVRRLHGLRRDFYIRISDPKTHPGNAPFRVGWLRRADWYTPDNPQWWGKWDDFLFEDEPESVGAEPPQPRPADPEEPADLDPVEHLMDLLREFFEKHAVVPIA